MSTGTNQERIEQNNTKLANLKTGIDNLPDYQNVEPIYEYENFMPINSQKTTYNTDNYQPSSISMLENYIGIVYVYYDYGPHNDGNQFFIKRINDDGTVTQIYQSVARTWTTGTSSGNVYGLIDIVDNYLYFTSGSSGSIKINRINLTTLQVETDYMSTSMQGSQYSGFSSLGKTKIFSGSYVYTVNVTNKTVSTSRSVNCYKFMTKDIVVSSNKLTITRYATGKTYTSSNTINWVNYAGNKTLINNNLYYISENMILGNLIKSNCIDNFDTNKVFMNVSGDYYITTDGDFYKFNEETNTFTYLDSYKTKTNSLGAQYTQYAWCNSEKYMYMLYSGTVNKLIGYSTDYGNLYIHNDSGVTSADVRNGVEVYDRYGNAILGAMSNNGTLNYTPSTSQQTIPKGYTDGGTIAAVTASIDSNIVAENIKKDITILGVTGTLSGDYSNMAQPWKLLKIF